MAWVDTEVCRDENIFSSSFQRNFLQKLPKHYKNGVDLNTVKELLGHKNIEMTM